MRVSLGEAAELARNVQRTTDRRLSQERIECAESPMARNPAGDPASPAPPETSSAAGSSRDPREDEPVEGAGEARERRVRFTADRASTWFPEKRMAVHLLAAEPKGEGACLEWRLVGPSTW